MRVDERNWKKLHLYSTNFKTPLTGSIYVQPFRTWWCLIACFSLHACFIVIPSKAKREALLMGTIASQDAMHVFKNCLLLWKTVHGREISDSSYRIKYCYRLGDQALKNWLSIIFYQNIYSQYPYTSTHNTNSSHLQFHSHSCMLTPLTCTQHSWGTSIITSRRSAVQHKYLVLVTI